MPSWVDLHPILILLLGTLPEGVSLLFAAHAPPLPEKTLEVLVVELRVFAKDFWGNILHDGDAISPCFSENQKIFCIAHGDIAMKMNNYCIAI